MLQEEQDKQDIKRYRLLRMWSVGLGFKDAPTWMTGENLDKLLDYELSKRELMRKMRGVSDGRLF